ncbi:hypothetical protein CRENPOLYSF1_1670001 [Crenothrix polyspora]|uniref:Uncharacterized protein n=1 Tax=Crenothrix polyspora TaxID=360316 RepID=A0A1R4H3W2_9GAMM|nr:hypothetical protein CRENPOLYSF1_1670001 [Crenothrix polyspora]
MVQPTLAQPYPCAVPDQHFDAVTWAVAEDESIAGTRAMP